MGALETSEWTMLETSVILLALRFFGRQVDKNFERKYDAANISDSTHTSIGLFVHQVREEEPRTSSE